MLVRTHAQTTKSAIYINFLLFSLTLLYKRTNTFYYHFIIYFLYRFKFKTRQEKKRMKFKLFTNDNQEISKLIFANYYDEFVDKGLFFSLSLSVALNGLYI